MKYTVIITAYNQLSLLETHLPYWESQTLKDFELLIADDGSSDGVLDWCRKRLISTVTQKHEGYRYTRIVNRAIKAATGDYIVFMAADLAPKPDFLKHIDTIITPKRVVNGIREQVTPDYSFIELEWRVKGLSEEQLESEILNIAELVSRPWELMTLSTLAIGREACLSLGGLYHEYDKGYGKMDWDLAANAFYNDLELVWAPRARAMHIKHKERQDTPNSTEVFNRRLAEFMS